MTTLPNLNLTLPIRGPSGSGHWADVLDTNLANIDNHNHTGSGRGLRLGAAALAIDADVSFNTSWAITALNRATFASVPPPGVNKSTWVSDGTGGTTAGELYWTSALGTNVKITAGNLLNVGAFVGGIGGDYQSVGAQLNYDDSAKRYTLKEGTVDSNHWARAACGGLRLFEFGTGNSIYVEQLCPTGIAGTYAITWPLALPSVKSAVLVDNAGQLSFVDITDKELYSAGFGVPGVGCTLNPPVASGAGIPTIALSTSTNPSGLPLKTKNGTTLSAWSVRLFKASAAGTITAKLFRSRPGDLQAVQIGSTQSNSGVSPGEITLGQSGLTEVVGTANAYYIEVVGGGTTGDSIADYTATTV